LFYAGFARALTLPSSVSQLEATLIEQASAALIQQNFAVAQIDGLVLVGAQYHQQFAEGCF